MILDQMYLRNAVCTRLLGDHNFNHPHEANNAINFPRCQKSRCWRHWHTYPDPAGWCIGVTLDPSDQMETFRVSLIGRSSYDSRFYDQFQSIPPGFWFKNESNWLQVCMMSMTIGFWPLFNCCDSLEARFSTYSISSKHLSKKTVMDLFLI